MYEHNRQLNVPEREEEILKFWEEKKVFEKSLKKNKGKKPFVFYEGPPTANGMPGIHHVEARAFKDAVLRYKSMRGFDVPRRAGWDTHGLPVEIQVEKKLGFKTKHDIENYGIARFNADAKRSVWEYKEEWERLTKRMGFWIDLKNPYITYETSYIETLWWIIKEFYKKGLLYEDFKVVPWCPRCQTGLSSHEVGLGYKEVEDTAVYVKFELEPNQKIGDFVTDDKTYILAWTTTPWTLPGNVALAVKPTLDYLKVKWSREFDHVAEGEESRPRPLSEMHIIAKDIFFKTAIEMRDIPGENSYLWRGKVYDIVEIFRGEDVIGKKYKPLFDVPEFRNSKTAYKIYPADFVSANDGTGVVHTAVMYGEDDYRLGQQVGLPKFHTVDETGHFVKEVESLSGWSIATREDKQKTEAEIIRILGDKIFHQEPYPHEYPHCWRCDTPLLYYARKAWWVKTTAVKKELLANNETTNWTPEHLKHGRFGEFLKDVRDWCFSRERYWGTPLPIWKCNKCGEIEVIGSRDELKKRSGKLPHDAAQEVDLHRPYVDEIKFDCVSCSGVMRRTPEVADVWFDSGAMPFAQNHYPFLPYETRSHRVVTGVLRPRNDGLAFPADYISEAVDQTRGWFYSMLAVATLLGRGAPYKNVISLGHVLDAKGQKMSKSKGNVVSPQEMMDKYGVDALRWYFFTINGPGEPKRFDEKDVALRSRGFVATLWNTFVFFDTYVKKVKNEKRKTKNTNVLDKWIMADLNLLVGHVTDKLDKYDLVGAARVIDEFAVNDFSQWYVRRSRRRFQHPENAQEKNEAAAVMAQVLLTLAELSAPFAPFISEAVYRGLRKKMGLKDESVHLRPWPKIEAGIKKFTPTPNFGVGAGESGIIKDMEAVRAIVAAALKLRAEAGIKVRQPLRELRIKNQELRGKEEVLRLIKDEVNVKEIAFGEEIKLDIVMTPELKEEGIVREFVRTVQDMRRELGMKPGEKVRCQIMGSERIAAILVRWEREIKKDTNAAELKAGGKKVYKLERESDLDGEKLWIGILAA